MSKPDSEDFTGTERFLILRCIGAGGMGVVYEAQDRDRGCRVALKTLFQLDAEALYRLKKEFRALADVIHPNLAALHELFSIGDRCFFTMEFINGVNFLEYARAEPPLSGPPLVGEEKGEVAPGGKGATPVALGQPPSVSPPDPGGRYRGGLGATVDYQPSTFQMAEEGEGDIQRSAPPLRSPEQFQRLRTSLFQLAEGVCALHAAGMLHRDIKPSNVLVTAEGRVVLLDFGLVVNLEQRLLEHGAEHEIGGTFAYMAPEQGTGQMLTAASDWYCVGVMLYEALTGRWPFLGRRSQVLREKREREAPPPGELVPGVPEDLRALCEQLLRRDPESRPSGSEILRRLSSPGLGVRGQAENRTRSNADRADFPDQIRDNSLNPRSSASHSHPDSCPLTPGSETFPSAPNAVRRPGEAFESLRRRLPGHPARADGDRFRSWPIRGGKEFAGAALS